MPLPTRPIGRLVAAFCLLVVPVAAPAQERPVPPDTIPATTPADTALAPADTASAGEVLERSPRGAFLRSLVLPGWGQAWVGAPVRGGVYFAMEAGALWMSYKSRQKLRAAREEERWLRRSGQLPLEEPYGLVREREDQQEDWLTIAIFLLFFTAADAWVSAHLVDFVDQVDVTPAPGGGMRWQARVPVGGGR